MHCVDLWCACTLDWSSAVVEASYSDLGKSTVALLLLLHLELLLFIEELLNFLLPCGLCCDERLFKTSFCLAAMAVAILMLSSNHTAYITIVQKAVLCF